jgi:hypothetical protein
VQPGQGLYTRALTFIYKILNNSVSAMKAFKLLIFLLIVLFVSCKKDNPYAVIEPGSYFPAYPNSWWKYLVNDSIIITDSTAHDYVLHNYKKAGYYDDPQYTDPVYVPYFYSKEIIGPIYKYDQIIFLPFGDGYEKWPILREEIGFKFERERGTQYPEMRESVRVVAKYFNGSDSVLILTGTFYNSWFNDPFTQKRYQEFVKDVGLVKDIIFDTITNDTNYRKILIDYKISNGL